MTGVSAAWVELAPSEYDAIWHTVDTALAFRPSVDHWPGIAEPTPFITASLRDPSEGDVAELTECALAMFRAITQPDEAIYALDWQHTSYRFRPHDHAPGASWPISVYPNGDYCVFLPDGVQWGWFGHPWEQTICLFGQPLLDALAGSSPRLLQRVMRRG